MERWSGRDWLDECCPQGCKWTTNYRGPMKGLFHWTFSFHFENLQHADHRHKTFLCFEVTRLEDNKFRKGVFPNQVGPHRPLHAELRFLSWFHDWLCPDASYEVTWYMSWSPCGECAEELATFLAGHTNVTLTIYISRLYYHQSPTCRKGLQALLNEGASVNIMFFRDFLDCWRCFVYNGYDYFEPWPHLTQNSLKYIQILKDILK